MSKSFEKDIFKKGSTTYYFSSKFFPKKLRRDVFRLYSFIRVTDDYVDETPEEKHRVTDIEKQYKAALADPNFDATTHTWDDQDTRIVKNMVRLTHRYKFEPAWVQSFLDAMKSDIKPRASKTLDDTLKYVHGSAEVVGLMMAKIMKLPEEAWEAAKIQGRAMQWINFLRDLKEDSDRGRQYFPDSDLKKAGLPELSESAARENPEAFKKFVDIQLKRYREWQQQATAAYKHIPKYFRIPLQTSRDMYNWTAQKIEKDPMVVWRKKVKPSKARVLAKGARKVTVRNSNRAYRYVKGLSRR